MNRLSLLCIIAIAIKLHPTIAGKKKEKQKECLGILEYCTEDLECCDNLECDKELQWLNGGGDKGRCRARSERGYAKNKIVDQKFLRKKKSIIKEIVKEIKQEQKRQNNDFSDEEQDMKNCADILDNCDLDSECCDDMICDKSVGAFGGKCRSFRKRRLNSDNITVPKKELHHPHLKSRRMNDCLRPFAVCSFTTDCCGASQCLPVPGNSDRRCDDPDIAGEIKTIQQLSNNVVEAPIITSATPIENKCLANFQTCNSDSECCGSLSCVTLVGSMYKRCYGLTATTEAPPIENQQVQPQMNAEHCLTSYEKCATNSECCDDMICTAEPGTMFTRCKSPSPEKIFSDENVDQQQPISDQPQCLESYRPCQNDEECCEQMNCVTLPGSMFTRCHNSPSQGLHVKQKRETKPSEPKEKQTCLFDLQTCNHDSECCNELNCIKVPGSMFRRCHDAPSDSLEEEDEVTPMCYLSFEPCEIDEQCCENLKCVNVPGTMFKKCHSSYTSDEVTDDDSNDDDEDEEERCLASFEKCESHDECCDEMKCAPLPGSEFKRCFDVEWNKNPIITGKNIKNKDEEEDDMCLGWRQDCTMLPESCCQGYSCSESGQIEEEKEEEKGVEVGDEGGMWFEENTEEEEKQKKKKKKKKKVKKICKFVKHESTDAVKYNWSR